MSNHYSRPLSLAGVDFRNFTIEELQALVRPILDATIHGISFSPYTDGQGPGTALSTQQIRDRLALIQSHVHWIRTFSCTDGNELIPAIAA